MTKPILRWSGNRSRVRRGVALVLSLAFIVLLSVLVTTYLFAMRLDRKTTANYSNAVRTQELARGAVVEILDDLQQEIVDNSNLTTYGDDSFYEPKTPLDVLAQRMGFEDSDYTADITLEPGKLPVTVLQASRFGELARASDVPSDTRALNGRYISAERWNKPKLMGVEPPDAFADNVPDWVYLTRIGSGVDDSGGLDPYKYSSDLSNEEQVLGRYAFVIYDQSGLLDVNVAGHTAAPASGSAMEDFTTALRGKSTLAYADLSALPGLKELSPEEREQLIDEFVNWRNKGSLESYGSDRFPEAVEKLQERGFLEMQEGDSPLLGRQDILQYFEEKGLPEEALAYLTHFTRAVTTPTWGPDKNSSEYDTYIAGADDSSAVEYRDDAENPASINPRLSKLRYDDNHNIIHYRDDGTIEPVSAGDNSYSYAVRNGDPFVQRRFSLAKLAWLGHEGPNEDAFNPALTKAQMEDAIYDCFGLRWRTGGSFPRWEYARNGSNSILTLDDVQKQGREPDFFELLKGVILNGSLGRDPGPGYATARHGNSRFYTGGLRHNQIYSEKDPQILQIGANIIDQADHDRYPTAIYSNMPLRSFTSPDVYSALSREYFSTVMGVENIPYIARVWNPYVTLQGRVGTRVRGYWGPEMWSPHRLPMDPDAPSPIAYRIRAFGVSQSVFATDPKEDLYNADEYIYSEPQDHEKSSDNFITFVDNGRFYKAPSRVLVSDAYGGEGTPSINRWSENYVWDAYKFMGIFTGEVVRPESIEDTVERLANPPPIPADPDDPDSVEEPRSPRTVWFNCRTTFPLGETPPTLISEYLGADGKWRPYGIFARFNVNRRNSGGAANNGTLNDSFQAAVVRSSNSRFDFRTDRLSCFHMENDGWGYYKNGKEASSPLWDDKSTKAAYFFLPLPNTGFYAFKDLSTSSSSSVRMYPAHIAQNVRYSPTQFQEEGWAYPSAEYSSFYTDPDGVVRPGDAHRVDLSTGDGDPLHFDPGATGPPTGGEAKQPYRSVVLDRPFQSVGELGYVFRDLPYRSLDFWTPYSADAGLLDVFAVRDEPRVSAGKVNINAAPRAVVEALLKGAGKHAVDTNIPALNDEEARAIAEAIIAESNLQPLQHSAEYVSRLAETISTALASTSSGASFAANKPLAEAPVRALTPVDNMRTWNLLIDVIAQSGRLPQSAQRLDQFVVEGETRYWVHVAIDRYTNEVVDYQLEAVYE